MGFLKYLNKIGGAKYKFLVRFVLLLPGSHNLEAMEQKGIFHRKLMGFLKQKTDRRCNIGIFSEVRLVSTT